MITIASIRRLFQCEIAGKLGSSTLAKNKIELESIDPGAWTSQEKLLFLRINELATRQLRSISQSSYGGEQMAGGSKRSRPPIRLQLMGPSISYRLASLKMLWTAALGLSRFIVCQLSPLHEVRGPKMVL